MKKVSRILRGMIGKINSNFKAKEVRNFFKDVDSQEYLHQLKTIKQIDKHMIGRYCGSLADKMMQSMSTYDVCLKFPSNRQYAHVEIGVLFGGSILAKLSILKRLNVPQSVIAIDPFEGYYEQSKDPATGLKVNEENFRNNISKFGFDNCNIKIIKKYSNDQQINSLISEYKVISLMIDGDHSYAGIKNDWEQYSRLVERGGYVIFDDYDEPLWPDVTKFVNELLSSKLQGWELLGKLDTTLILKRI